MLKRIVRYFKELFSSRKVIEQLRRDLELARSSVTFWQMEAHDRGVEARQNHRKYAMACNRATDERLNSRFANRKGVNLDFPAFEWRGFKFFTDISMPENCIIVRKRDVPQLRILLTVSEIIDKTAG